MLSNETVRILVIMAVILAISGLVILLVIINKRYNEQQEAAALEVQPVLEQPEAQAEAMDISSITIFYFTNEAIIAGTIKGKAVAITVKLDDTMKAVCEGLRRCFEKRYF